MMAAPRKIRCPQCGGKAWWVPENPWRPFCSERCKQIDLGAWASDAYRIPVQGGPGEADGEAPSAELPVN